MKKIISAAERRHRDSLRRKGLSVGHAYEKRLVRARRSEVRRVLGLAAEYDGEEDIVRCIEANLDESGYLPKWFAGLYREAGLPMMRSTARDLRTSKAFDDLEDDLDDVWLATMERYARQRAGENIVLVSGTLRTSLVRITRDLMAEDLGLGVEKLTKRIFREYVDVLEKWQCRRIAQTETMIALADSAAAAAETLDIKFTKQWCISGLGNTRESHEVMDGVIVDQDEPFILEGGMMLYPHDTSLGADASEIINCACDCIRWPK